MSKQPINIQFVNHIQAGLPEQDVFIERGDVPAGYVVRPEGADATGPANLARMIYATATATPDDPFKVGPSPLGPFAKGKSMSLTLEQWLSASGRGTYAPNGQTAELKLSFDGLVPNGVYMLLAPRITFPPNFAVEPGIVGAPDGSQAGVVADAHGRAEVHLELQPLPESTPQTATAIILAYNSEGSWHGEFGKNTHQQMFFLMPPGAGPVAAEWRV